MGNHPGAKEYEGIILNSLDGVTWNATNVPTKSTFILNAVTYGKNLFVAVGASDDVLVSWDGINWLSRPAGKTDYLWDVTYGNGTFVTVGYAVGYPDSSTIFTSQDGLHWTGQPQGIARPLYGVGYGKDVFIAVGLDGDMILSRDGRQWSRIETGFSNLLWSVAIANDTIVAVGHGFFPMGLLICGKAVEKSGTPPLI